MISGPVKAKTISSTVSSVALTLVTFGYTTAEVAAADRVIISVTANALRVSWDHPTTNAPTTSAGLKLGTNNYPFFVLQGRSNLAALQMIRDAAADATIIVTLECD
jgi:hypothetical protein